MESPEDHHPLNGRIAAPDQPGEASMQVDRDLCGDPSLEADRFAQPCGSSRMNLGYNILGKEREEMSGVLFHLFPPSLSRSTVGCQLVMQRDPLGLQRV